MSLELGYSTVTLSERDTVYLPAREQVHHRLGRERCRGALVRQVLPAEEPAESAAEKRQCDKRQRSKKRDDCATRTSATGGWTRITRVRPEPEEE